MCSLSTHTHPNPRWPSVLVGSLGHAWFAGAQEEFMGPSTDISTCLSFAMVEDYKQQQGKHCWEKFSQNLNLQTKAPFPGEPSRTHIVFPLVSGVSWENRQCPGV